MTEIRSLVSLLYPLAIEDICVEVPVIDMSENKESTIVFALEVIIRVKQLLELKTFSSTSHGLHTGCSLAVLT